MSIELNLMTCSEEDLVNIVRAASPDQLVELIVILRNRGLDKAKGTPANRWSGKGEVDNFANYLDLERSRLALGDLTDDELANAVYLHGNEVPRIAEVMAGTAKMPIVYLTAAKERIRWLSRQVTRLTEQNAEKELVQRTAGEEIPPRVIDQQTDEFKDIIKHSLVTTPVEKLTLGTRLSDVIEAGGGFKRGVFHMIVAKTGEEARVITSEDK